MSFNQFNQSNQKKKKRPVVDTENFVEALKGIGGGVTKGVREDVIAGTAKNAFDTIFRRAPLSGELKPDNAIELDKLQEEQAETQAQAEHRHLHILKQKEEMVFSAREEHVKKQIEDLKEELKKLAKETGNVAREVQVATMQEAVDPGSYHVTFFEHLKRLIRTLRQKLHDSAGWLHAANQRAEQKKGMYWGRVKKQGTKYMLSQERTMATQSG